MPFRLSKGFGGGASESADGVAASGTGVAVFESRGCSDGDGSMTGSGGTEADAADFEREGVRVSDGH